ncbi:hypothetical protein SKAU_G00389580 [Synaphobranchus kaupii]|uniref:Uncharacterized protein n=1 Tax=Synaphobranchus kaupii TaxID=118154 RepID=A0A9Q1EBB2_SYNKA|nr:hypothetical protein SKAU_G00389580 [Synaphobranchus kaupii]
MGIDSPLGRPGREGPRDLAPLADRCLLFVAKHCGIPGNPQRNWVQTPCMSGNRAPSRPSAALRDSCSLGDKYSELPGQLFSKSPPSFVPTPHSPHFSP